MSVVYVTGFGKKYHKKDCRCIKSVGSYVVWISLKQALVIGLTKCKVCG